MTLVFNKKALVGNATTTILLWTVFIILAGAALYIFIKKMIG